MSLENSPKTLFLVNTGETERMILARNAHEALAFAISGVFTVRVASDIDQDLFHARGGVLELARFDGMDLPKYLVDAAESLD